ncbi:MAG: type II secretion system F family protein [Armatimonadetes bacterium]|nr:type II secretion system F family protein [Armatimonadota bacterium]MCX7968049.1 type II secretion system F family protein [Armatimonadota bacterium]MDW8143157.1 type II secretion system F family protein [Armatimonadota bacterium]
MFRRNPLERLAEMENLKPPKKATSKRRALSFLARFVRTLGGFIPSQSRSKLRMLIHRAGLAGRLRAEEVFGVKLIGFLTLPFVGFYLGTSINMTLVQSLILALLFGIAGFTAPDFWLSRQARRRCRLIERHLPDFVDLLATCVEAGLGLDAAIDRITRRFSGPIAEEFQRYLWEVQIGRPRNLALMGIAERTSCDDIRILAASLTQAELFGIPIANVLRTQAEALRERRFQQARERARRAPLLMLPALAFCFCPVIFLLLFVPLFLRARQSGLLQFLGF